MGPIAGWNGGPLGAPTSTQQDNGAEGEQSPLQESRRKKASTLLQQQQEQQQQQQQQQPQLQQQEGRASPSNGLGDREAPSSVGE